MMHRINNARSFALGFFLHNNKHVMETKIGHNKSKKKLTKKRRKCEMIDSRKHLPGSLSEPGYEAHSRQSQDTRLIPLEAQTLNWAASRLSGGKVSIQLLSDWARGHFLCCKFNVPVQVYRSHTLCLNFLFEFTMRSLRGWGVTDVEGGFSWAFEGRILPYSDWSSLAELV